MKDDEDFGYYGRIKFLDRTHLHKYGVHKFMLEEMVVQAFERIEKKIISEVKSELTDLRKEVDKEIKKQNDAIKVLNRFRDNLEADAKRKEEEEVKRIADAAAKAAEEEKKKQDAQKEIKEEPKPKKVEVISKSTKKRIKSQKTG